MATRTLLLLALSGVVCWSAQSQTTDRSSFLEQPNQQKMPQSAATTSQGAEKLQAIPMEGAVDPDVYVLGPSDLLQIATWGPLTSSITIPVTPEGTVIVPMVGEVKISGRNLTEAKRAITSLIRKRYQEGEISVTLVKPRLFTVSLRGVVSKPGEYIVSAVDRVDKVVMKGAAVQYPTSSFAVPAVSSKDEYPITAESYKSPRIEANDEPDENASLRNIVLVRKTGDTVHVDIPLFQATGLSQYDPFLLDGDAIFVPKRLQESNSVVVSGAVNAPGIYEYVAGDDLRTMLAIAGGLTPLADSSAIVLVRPGSEGSLQQRQISLNAEQGDEIRSWALQRGDHIVVKERSSLVKTSTVRVLGEVRLPGMYPILEGTSRLTDVVESAGGFTADALLSGSYVMRKEKQLGKEIDPRLELLRNLRTHELSFVDSTVYFLNLRLGYQPVVADFAALFAGGDSTFDIPLRGGDVILIASNERAVLVQGQVASPGYVPYVEGSDLAYYVQKAGGFADRADDGEVKVIKRGTLEWKDPSETTIESGDQIWVPKIPKREFGSYLGQLRDIAQIASAVVTAGYFLSLILK